MKLHLTLLSISFFGYSSYAQEQWAAAKGAILFDGYDPVAFFDSQVVKGLDAYSTYHEGRRILFSSQENEKKFEEDKEKYFPAYGGWCAIAMVDGTFVVPDYTLYKIQDDQLLFFSVRAFFNGLTAWNKDAMSNKVKADRNYLGIFK
ncbi:MAG: YHS domain protein [Cyclobacteriaceae bacterium]|nr:YHS domain protein [Cyclobacteriaceae bacterium HetDA_MAG_MS6]